MPVVNEPPRRLPNHRSRTVVLRQPPVVSTLMDLQLPDPESEYRNNRQQDELDDPQATMEYAQLVLRPTEFRHGSLSYGLPARRLKGGVLIPGSSVALFSE